MSRGILMRLLLCLRRLLCPGRRYRLSDMMIAGITVPSNEKNARSANP